MKVQIDTKFCLDCLKEFINTPSPVSYYEEVNPLIEKYGAMFGQEVTFDRKHTGYICLDGENNEKTIMIGAHLDTLGLMVRSIEADGTIRVRNLGGVSHGGIDNETVTIHTRDGRSYTGLYVCQSHSTHVFDDARTMLRDSETMIISLDQKITCKEDVIALGIENGDIVSIEPRFQATENGYIKTRFIDDKAAVAVTFAVLKFFTENQIKPKYRTLLTFPHYEEINHGGAFVPEEVDEFVAIDIGLIGPGLNGRERAVSICAKDNFTPYDRELTTKLINLAKESVGENYAVDVFYRYGTDASAAWRSGNNVSAAAFGMACWCSHGMERTHIDGIENTAKLLAAYLLSE
ncbi:MAG: M42 family metallopeptidase [Lachnospiraceae bacterium]